MGERRYRSRLTVVAGVCATVFGCAQADSRADTVVFASGADLESGNPLVTIHPLSRQIQRFALFTTLARYDSDLQPEPYLARDWDWNSERTELTFHLVTGLNWHDGQSTTARDVVFTLLAAKDPVTGYARAGDLASIDTVIASDDSTAMVRFSGPVSTFPLVLCELPVVPQHVLGSVPREAMRAADFNMAPVGNGPFRFVERAPGQRWSFKRNDSFPSALGGPPLISHFVVAVVDEPTTKFAGLASGDLDFAGIAPTMASLAAGDPSIRVVDYPVLFTVGLVLNTHRPPFDDVRVRNAINLSIDRTRIVEAALAGFGVPAAGPVPSENPLAASGEPEQNVDRADSLLNATGWVSGTDGMRVRDGVSLSVELLTVGSGDLAIEQLVQSDLRARGIDVVIRSMEMGTFLARARSAEKDFDVLLTGIPGDLSLAYINAMYDSRQRGSSLDYGAYHTDELDGLFEAIEAAETAARAGLWRRVQETLARETPTVWLYHARGVQGVAARMQGVEMDLRGELVSISRWSISGN